MHHHIAGERHCEVVAQAFLADTGAEAGAVVVFEQVIVDIAYEIARVEHLEQEFVAFLSILAHEGLEGFHRGVSMGAKPYRRNTSLIVSKI